MGESQKQKAARHVNVGLVVDVVLYHLFTLVLAVTVPFWVFPYLHSKKKERKRYDA